MTKFLIGWLIGLASGYFFTTVFVVAPQGKKCFLSPEIVLTLQAVENDTLLQKMILDPTYRLRIKQCEKSLK